MFQTPDWEDGVGESKDDTFLNAKERKSGKSIKRTLSALLPSKPHLLKQGIKFSSPKEFEEFLTKESAKMKKIEKKKESKSVKRTSTTKGLQPQVLRKLFKSSSPEIKLTKEQEALRASRFRFINEKLYTQTGPQSKKMFKEDFESFKVYHEGFQSQAKKWPLDPLSIIISSLSNKKSLVIADMGCGEARLASELTKCTVHSFDLVALNDRVTACEMSNTPLDSDSVDAVVFSLSLMGTNLKDYLKEANRILKMGGVLKIAEVESRFANTTVPEFIKIVERFGFSYKWKDLTKKLFYLIDFVKESSSKKKLPELSLKPCYYKKR